MASIRFKISERASFEAGSTNAPQPTASAVAEGGKSSVPKADGGDREKKFKRTERIRNLDRELKRSLHAASAQQMHVAADDSDADDGSEAVRKTTPLCRRRIRISGFSFWQINGVYEETQEEGPGDGRVLQHVDDSNLCLELLNGACCMMLCSCRVSAA